MISSRFKRAMLLIMCIAILTSMFAGCSGKSNESGSNENATGGNAAANKPMEKVKVVVHRAGGIQERQDDKLVKETIEKKFLDDTGVNVDFDFKLHSNEDFNNKVNLAIAAKDQIDVIQNYIGDNGVNIFIDKPGLIKPLDEYINKHGENLKKTIPQLAWDSIKLNGSIMGIPSVGHESIFGILIRKDWVTELGLKMPETIEQFEQVMEAFKNRGPKIIPLIGYPWDIDRVILPGAYGAVPYFGYYVDPADNLIKPGSVNPLYKQVVKKEYEWVKKGWWDKDNKTRPWESMLNQFISGQAGIFIGWAEITHLIEMSRKAKAANPDAEFEILGPLAGPDGKKGFMKQPLAFTGFVIPQQSKNAEYIVKYVDWLYSSVDNYELAHYGIKDTHWTAPEDGVRGLPEGKQEEYTANPPYSSVFALVENVRISDRLNDTYSEQEREWIKNVRSFAVYPNPAEGIIFPKLPDYQEKYDEVNTNLFAKCFDPAWAGLEDPENTFDKYRDEFDKAMKGYFEELTKVYNEKNQAK